MIFHWGVNFLAISLGYSDNRSTRSVKSRNSFDRKYVVFPDAHLIQCILWITCEFVMWFSFCWCKMVRTNQPPPAKIVLLCDVDGSNLFCFLAAMFVSSATNLRVWFTEHTSVDSVHKLEMTEWRLVGSLFISVELSKHCDRCFRDLNRTHLWRWATNRPYWLYLVLIANWFPLSFLLTATAAVNYVRLSICPCENVITIVVLVRLFSHHFLSDLRSDLLWIHKPKNNSKHMPCNNTHQIRRKWVSYSFMRDLVACAYWNFLPRRCSL